MDWIITFRNKSGSQDQISLEAESREAVFKELAKRVERRQLGTQILCEQIAFHRHFQAFAFLENVVEVFFTDDMLVDKELQDFIIQIHGTLPPWSQVLHDGEHRRIDRNEEQPDDRAHDAKHDRLDESGHGGQ